jgi:hypothetical protein
MPRKAAAALAVIPRVPGRGRPEPPPELDPLEQRIWREVIDALPDHWLDQAGQVLLRRLVAQAAAAERQELRLRQLRAEGRDDTPAAIELAAAHGAVAKIVTHLLDALRATPKSQLRIRSAGAQATRASGWRPWEIRGGGKAQTELEQ